MWFYVSHAASALFSPFVTQCFVFSFAARVGNPRATLPWGSTVCQVCTPSRTLFLTRWLTVSATYLSTQDPIIPSHTCTYLITTHTYTHVLSRFNPDAQQGSVDSNPHPHPHPSCWCRRLPACVSVVPTHYWHWWMPSTCRPSPSASAHAVYVVSTSTSM